MSEECPPGGQEGASEPGVNYDAAARESHIPRVPSSQGQGLWADWAATLLSHSALDQTEVTLSLWPDRGSCTPGVFVTWIALSMGVDTHPVLSESIKGNAASSKS